MSAHRAQSGRGRRALARSCAALVRFLDAVGGALRAALREEQDRTRREAGKDDSRDLFDELPEPPHLEYGEVRHRDGRFKYLDG